MSERERATSAVSGGRGERRVDGVNRLQVIGHRGVRAGVTENTLLAYREAERLGCDQIEVDVRVTADGEVVILHDASPARVAIPSSPMRDVPVAELTAEQLASVRLPEAQRIPTLFEALRATTVPLQVEIKARESVPLLEGIIQRVPGAATRVTITSFDDAVLADAARLVPRAPLGLIRSSHHAENWSLLEALPVDVYCPGWEGLTSAEVARLHDHGLLVDAWPVANREQLEQAVELGVDAITVDDPAVFVPLARGLAGAAQ